MRHTLPTPTIGLLAALGPELGPFRRSGASGHAMRVEAGVELVEHRLEGVAPAVLSALSGVGKVRAAHAAAALIGAGAGVILVVGTCGALDGAGDVGELCLATEAVQWDLAVREGRRVAADPELLEAWAAVVPAARRATFLTADRPALGPVDRLRRARSARRGLQAEPGATLVAEMETAAVAAVCLRAGVPWASLRVVSDRSVRFRDFMEPNARAQRSFTQNFARVAAEPAATVARLLASLHPTPA